jgi:L-2-hydroxyglutarate oxidase LhgO
MQILTQYPEMILLVIKLIIGGGIVGLIGYAIKKYNRSIKVEVVAEQLQDKLYGAEVAEKESAEIKREKDSVPSMSASERRKLLQ